MHKAFFIHTRNSLKAIGYYGQITELRIFTIDIP
uniref:Uncharacterized protein n=1 Tax=Siphoviridae sp. ctwfx1 TaxID=2825732 RepID=A0A8S5UVR8_9CAUD|nr:MAG TPA: hypothetical protein [Siphoviridae sp. ctwfx1]